MAEKLPLDFELGGEKGLRIRGRLGLVGLTIFGAFAVAFALVLVGNDVGSRAMTTGIALLRYLGLRF